MVCKDKKCKLADGQFCSDAEDCGSGLCIGKVCRATKLAPNEACRDHTDCVSDQCGGFSSSKCTRPDGSFQVCGTGTKMNREQYYCARYGNGLPCANSGECLDGRCKGGVCAPGEQGDACVEDYQCSSADGLSCVSGTCSMPVVELLKPTEICEGDAQCSSGSCTAYSTLKDEYGVYLGQHSGDGPQLCELFEVGQGPCAGARDCKAGLCKDGLCAMGLDGDRCAENEQCDEGRVCSAEGVCQTPGGGAGHPGELCKRDDQCVSGHCSEYGPVQRYAPDTVLPVDEATVVRYWTASDLTCAVGELYDGCTLSWDCASGSCEEGQCVEGGGGGI